MELLSFSSVSVIAAVAVLGFLVFKLTGEDKTRALTDHRIDRTGLIGDLDQDGAAVAGDETFCLSREPADSLRITAAVRSTTELLFDEQQPTLDPPAEASTDTIREQEGTTTQTPGLSAIEMFVGQERIKAALNSRIERAQVQREALSHIMLTAPPEMGKVTLATAIANTLGVPVEMCNGRELPASLDLTGILSNVHARQILIVEEPESIPWRVRKMLESALSEFRVAILVDIGPGARTHSLPMPQFTFVGVTSRLSQVDPSLRRWCVMYEFDPYTNREIGQILTRVAETEGIRIAEDAALDLASHCNGCPGNAWILVQRIKRDSRPAVDGTIAVEQVPAILSALGFGEHYPRSLLLLDTLNAMDGRDFEHWSAGMFRRQGYVVNITGTTGDHGIDLVLAKDGQTTAVQCKRWADLVGEPVLRDFYGATVSAGIAEGIVVATSSFTPSAREFAQNKPIRLIDIDELLAIGCTSVSRSEEI